MSLRHSLALPAAALLLFIGPAWAQKPAAAAVQQLETDLQQLKAQVAQIEGQQQQLLRLVQALQHPAPTAAPQPQVRLPKQLSVAGAPVLGSPSARVAIIEYTDFQCPYCGDFARTAFPPLNAAFIRTSKVRLFYRPYPLPFHQYAFSAARAAACANEQGKFWPMYEDLYAHQAQLTQADILGRAAKLGLNSTQLQSCLRTTRYTKRIQQNIQSASAMNIQGTPTFILGTIQPGGAVVMPTTAIVGAYPVQTYEAAIDLLLKSKAPAHSGPVAIGPAVGGGKGGRR